MTTRADIIIRDEQYRPIAAIEVKNRMNLTQEVATAYRRNLLVHGLTEVAPYFLLLSQDWGYLWSESGGHGLEAAPVLEFSMEDVVARYVPQRRGERLDGGFLEFIVFQWLLDLSLDVYEPTGESERSLQDTGFLDAIRGARIATEAA